MVEDPDRWRPTQRALEALLAHHLRTNGDREYAVRAAGYIASLFASIGRESVLIRHLSADDVRAIFAAIPALKGNPNGSSGSAHEWTRRFLRALAAHEAARIPATTTEGMTS